MISYHDLLKEGRTRLYEANADEQAAMLLLNELCQKKDINLYINMEEHPDEEVQTDYLEGIYRMEQGEPLAYVLGYQNFYGYDFDVNEDVLIPRPETEQLTAQVLIRMDENFADKEYISVFDVACGSGTIGITLSLEEPKAEVISSDISEKAVETAWSNNQKLGGRANFIVGDMLDPFIERNLHCDILVCNPPYIPAQEKMEHSVVDYEPHLALFGGNDGLYFYRKVFEKADQVLNENGLLAFEMGYDQRENLTRLARETYPDAEIEVLKDLEGNDRMLFVQTGGIKK